jgi:hypothetical protein
LFDRSRFFVPTMIVRRAARSRGQAGRGYAGATWFAFARPRLDGGEHGAMLVGRTIARGERRDMILDWAANGECGIITA